MTEESTEKINIIFDSQILNSVQLCALRTKYMFHDDLQPPEKATPLEEGDLLHQMFEMYNLGLIAGNNQELLYDNVKWQALVDKCVAHGESVAPAMNLIPAEISEVIFQFTEYVKFTRMDGVIVLEAERPFMVELFNDDTLRVLYTGKIDRVTNTPHYGVCARDYKKTARHQTPTPLSNQFTGYAYATGSQVVMVDKVGFQKTLPPEKRFITYPIYYTKDSLQEWKDDTIWWARQYAFYIETGTWPRNRTSCDKYSGCLYLDICQTATGEAREHIIKTKYIVGEKWDPTAVLRRPQENKN